MYSLYCSYCTYCRCTPLLLANVCVGCMMAAEEDCHSREERQKRSVRAMCLQAVLIDLLTTQSL